MIDLPASIGFQPSYAQLTIPVSQTKYGGRTISNVEYADSYRTVDMETAPLTAGQGVQLQSFIAAAKGGAETIIYRPTHICILQAYWGDADNPQISGTATRSSDRRIHGSIKQGRPRPRIEARRSILTSER